MACVGYTSDGIGYVVYKNTTTPGVSLQVSTTSNQQQILTSTDYDIIPTMDESLPWGDFVPGTACGYYYPNLYLTGIVTNSSTNEEYHGVAVVRLDTLSRDHTYRIYRTDTTPTVATKSSSSGVMDPDSTSTGAGPPVQTPPDGSEPGTGGTNPDTPQEKSGGGGNGGGNVGGNASHKKRAILTDSYTMIAPVNFNTTDGLDWPCFALVDSNKDFHITCTNEGNTQIYRPYVGDATIKDNLISILSYDQGNKLFVFLGNNQQSQVYQLPSINLQATTEQPLPIPSASYSLANNIQLEASPSKLFVYDNSVNLPLKALWAPSNYDGTFVHILQEDASVSNTLRLSTVTLNRIDSMQGVNQADVGMTVDPAANANTVYIAYKSPNAATTPPAVQAIPNFQTLEEGNFNPGNPIGDVPPTSGNEGHSSNNAGTIAGAVVGSVVGLALILGLLIYFLKKHRKSRTREFESLRGGEKSQSSSAAAWPFVGNGGNATSSPVKQYGDIGNVSSIRPVDVNAAELEALEPTSPMADGAVVLGGLYQFTRESPAFLDQQQTRIPKYAMRGIVYQNGGETYTLHYFITSTRDAFIKNVTTTVALANSSRVIQHRDAIAMSHPTRRSGYQYLWITEPCLPQQSLHYVLTGSDKSIDIHEYPFKAWSTYAMLEALKEVHAANFVHLGLTPYSFYYTDPEQVSDWKITGFDQSHSIGERVSEAHLNQWSAPELFATASRDNRRCYRQTVQPASDIWSLGCIIYTLATGRSLTIDLSQTAQLSRSDREQLYAHVNIACNEAGSVNDSYRTLLEGMLHPDPAKRNTAANLAAYWKEANGLYDDDEEENNEAEESIVTP